ncbi:ABC transporter ATP-binding protein [Clavibacter zhangzhiyongii]|uniref:ABC transporter ATP-binding protein n=1 Tax=Clavibacter zhangzhiyongii TaxID=2768071 RepID=UPI00195DFB00|nr:ATP-binding cassette domain-containing protein [Clavibacter zhangzhiyongii]MBM7026814.1 ATP-binding cassette domain-containing protein [Clavibacter zhangzhiyongii]
MRRPGRRPSGVRVPLAGPGSTAEAGGGASVRASGWGWRHAGRSAWAVRDVDLVIEPGERVLLLGASGAGKTTLLHALAGVLGGDDEGEAHGSLTIDGHDPAALRGRAGLVLQDPDAQVILSRVGDDVAFGCENLGVPREEIWVRVRHALDAVGLDVALDRSTTALSGGQKQRLALAGVLAMRPGLLLLDEPTANLDPEGVGEVRRAVEAVVASTGATLVVIEHRVAVWQDLVDRVVVLGADGGILADGVPDDVLRDQGASLAAAGVWVPGREPRAPVRAPAGGAALVRADDLAIGRGRGPAVADGLAVALASGRVRELTGPNGSGKSTLALTLGGLLPARSGRVVAEAGLADGLSADPAAWRSRELAARIGTVFQDPEHQFLAATVRAELEVGPRAVGTGEAETARRVDELLVRLRLDGLARANPFTLSGGEKRRLSVATALATAPRLLVLDEPTFGQDSRTWAELVALLADLVDREGVGVLAVTHDADLVRALADDVLRLEPVPDAPARLRVVR